MKAKIKDLIEVVPAGSRAPSESGGLIAELGTFLLSYDTGDALGRTIDRLVGLAGLDARNCLVVGGSGCGKSRLMSAASALLEIEPSVALPHPRMADIRALAEGKRILVVRIPQPTKDVRLSSVVEHAAVEAFQTAGLPPPVDHDWAGQGARLTVLSEVVAALPADARMVFFLDDLDLWLNSSARFALENAQTMIRLGELSRLLPMSTCAAGGEFVISQASGLAGQGWIGALLESFRIEYVPARAVRSATASKVLIKNARQRGDILDVLQTLREKLPNLECSDEEFVELYPLEISTWNVGSHLHRWLDGFSFPDFAARAADSVKRRPAASLFALNDMFALYEPQLRRVQALEAIFEAYDRLANEALARLGQSQRLWGSLALQSIFMHSIAGIAADATTITNSVLLYDLHGGSSGYAMMSAVLKQLETLGRGQLRSTADGTIRRYSLVAGTREALLASIDEIADGLDEGAELTLELLRFGGQHFADWPFGASVVGTGRLDLWEIEQSDRRITLEARNFDDGESGEEHGRLVLFSPGTAWSEANEEARSRPNTACWLAAAPTPEERSTLRRWLAAARRDENSRVKSLTDLSSLRADLSTEAAAVFKRLYIDMGLRVLADRSDPIVELVQPSRDDNFIVRLLPDVARKESTPSPAFDVLAPMPSSDEQVWIACLLADKRTEVEAFVKEFDKEAILHKLEAWYSHRVARDDSGPTRLLGDWTQDYKELADALEAKQLFDVAIFYVRRALASRSMKGLGDALAKAFETPEKLWLSRDRIAWLERFADWTPAFEHAVRYVQEADRVEDQGVEELRDLLARWAVRVDEFLDERKRADFIGSFEAFRTEYSRCYIAAHDESVGSEIIDKLSSALVESRSWNTLESFSALTIGNPSYLVDAINLVSVLRDAQCTEDVRAALGERSTCMCGFRLSDRDRVKAMASSAGEFIQMGVDHHRKLLHSRRDELKEKLRRHRSAFDLETMRAIADATKDGPLPHIEGKTIQAINDLLEDSVAYANGIPTDQALTYRMEGT